MKKYKVTGMSCAACSSRVERAVLNVRGVSACSVNLLTNTLLVEGDAAEENIISAVSEAGYAVQIGKKEDETLSADDEKVAIAKRLMLSSALLFLLLYITMGHIMLALPLPEVIARNPMAIVLLELLISLFIMLINRSFFINGFSAIVRRTPNMDTLVALGSFASFVYSLAVSFIISEELVLGNINTAFVLIKGLYFESAAMILVLISIGKLLLAYAKGKTTNSIRALMDLTPKIVRVIRDGKEVSLPVGEVVVGDVFLVRQGENVAVDGVVLEGDGVMNESALTGESIPIEKGVGDKILGATTLISGFLKCRATEVMEDTVIASVIKLVTDATASKAPIAKIADRVSGVFVPIVIGIAFLTTLIWGIFGNQDFGYALGRGLSVLVISCPCALGLATPVAIMVGNGVGARRGIFFKTAEALELCGRAKIVAFDKTGTLTSGELSVTDIVLLGDVSKDELLGLAGSLEYSSEHPIARAILKCVEGQKLHTVEGFEAKTGLGVLGIIDGSVVVGGNLKFISSYAEITDYCVKEQERLSHSGKTPIIFAKNGMLIGIIALRDEAKKDAKETVEQISNMGIRAVVLTGDNEKTARAIAESVGINEIYSSLLPADKERILSDLSKEGRVVMVGDGINDAPALARADVGIAIGSGTDIAIESADVVLCGRELSEVSFAISLSRKVLANIKQNLFFAFIYNIIGIPLAAGALLPLFSLEMNPMFSAIAMSLSSITVVTNALRLNFFKSNIKKGANKVKKVLTIEGMMCPHCEARVKNALLEMDGVVEAEVNHNSKEAVVTLSKSIDDSFLADAITAQGYKVISIKSK